MKALIAPYLGWIKAGAIIVMVLGIFYAGTRYNESKWLKKQADAVVQTLDGERELSDLSNQATSDYIVRLQSQLKAANALPKITLVNDCPVPAAVGRLLNDAQRVHSDAPTGSGSSDTGKGADPAR